MTTVKRFPRKWRHKLKVKEEWKAAERREITPGQFAAVVAKQLRAMRADGAEDMAEQFECFAEATEGEDDCWDEFDSNWEDLYDWADANDVWVEIF